MSNLIFKTETEFIRYKDLLEKAGDRNLVRVKTTKTTEDLPRFRIMSDVDLEVTTLVIIGQITYSIVVILFCGIIGEYSTSQ